MEARRRKHREPTAADNQREDQKNSSSDKEKSSSFGLLKYVLLVLVLPAIMNHAALYQEERQLKPAGELYDIGWGEKLFMNCSGDGVPTILLDAPTGKSSEAWRHVQPLLAEFTTVCVYDRAGLGFSPRPMENWSQGNQESVKNAKQRGQPFTSERMVDDFHQLFTASSSRRKPFVLVGAGLGAVNMRFYSHIYDEDVAGIVLINPLSESLFSEENKSWTENWYGNVVSSLQMLQFFAAVGLNRLALITGLMKTPMETDTTTERQTARQKYLLCRPAHISSAVDEHFFANVSLAQLRTMKTLKSLPNVPVSVISSSYYDRTFPDAVNKVWMEQQSLLVSNLAGFRSQHKQISCSEEELLTKNYRQVVKEVHNVVTRWRRKQTQGQI